MIIASFKIAFGQEYGQVDVRIGDTRVFVSTSCEVATPSPDRPSEGFFTFNVQFSPLASLIYDGGRARPSEIILVHIVSASLIP